MQQRPERVPNNMQTAPELREARLLEALHIQATSILAQPLAQDFGHPSPLESLRGSSLSIHASPGVLPRMAS